jgi:HK97 family phage portal protein
VPKKPHLNFAQRIIGRMAVRALKYAGIPLRDPALKQMFGVMESDAGIEVNEDTARNCSAVWSAISLISSATASLPFRVYYKDDNRPDPVCHDHVVNTLLNVSPNEQAMAYTFREVLQSYATSWGNGYAIIRRQKDKQDSPVVALDMVPASEMKYDWRDNGSLFYTHTGPGDNAEYEPWQILHIPGLGVDAVGGESVISRARQGIGLGLASEKFGASFYGKGAVPRIVVTHPETLTKTARKNFRQGVGLLEEGMTVQPLSLPQNDAQFLETRQFQIVEVARWFRVPPNMLYDLTAATENNNEQMALHFLQYTLWPWLIRWKQECTRKLFTMPDHEMFYLDFDTTYLLMADMKSRYESYAVGRNNGFMTINDINRRERLPLLPPEIGDTHLRASTMLVLENRDPSMPIPVETITALLDQLKAMREKLVAPLPSATCEAIINAAIPSGSAGLTAQLLAYCKSSGIATGKVDTNA